MLYSGKKALSALRGLNPVVWALIPYSIEDSQAALDSDETKITKAELAGVFNELGLSWRWQPVVPGAIGQIVAQLSSSMQSHLTVAFNFCDGLDRDGYPGVSVIKALEKAAVPFTGSDSQFYQISTYKLRMKRLFRKHGIETAPWEVLHRTGPVKGTCARLGTPLMIKPDVSCASYGISLKSKVVSDAEIMACRDELQQGENAELFSREDIFAERYLAGDEFTVFVGGYWDDPDQLWNLAPARRCFADSVPPEERFLSYDRYWGYFEEESRPSGGEPFYRYELVRGGLGKELVDLAFRAYRAVRGYGYARVDIRRDAVNGKLSVLEVNANCGLSGDSETSTGSILQLMGNSYSDLIATILNQTLRRHRKAGQRRKTSDRQVSR